MGWINDNFGKCNGEFIIYLSKEENHANQLHAINNSILPCDKQGQACKKNNINNSKKFGIFTVNQNSPIWFSLIINKQVDISLYLFMSVCLIIIMIGLSNMFYVEKYSINIFQTHLCL